MNNSKSTKNSCVKFDCERPSMRQITLSYGTTHCSQNVSPTPWATLQKVNITRRTLETTYCFLLVCRSNNIANSHLSPGPLNNMRYLLLFGAAVLTPWTYYQWRIDPITNCELWLDACILHQRTTFNSCSHPTCWASSERSHTATTTLFYGN